LELWEKFESNVPDFEKIPFVTFVCILVLIDVSESPTDEKKPIDIYAIGFEEMVDLDAKNIMNTR
jgi:hypothetical protein